MSFNHQRAPYYYNANYDSRPQPLRIHGSQVNVRSLIQYFNNREFEPPAKPRQQRDPISPNKVKSLVTNFNRLETFEGFSVPGTVASPGEPHPSRKFTVENQLVPPREVLQRRSGERQRILSPHAVSGDFEEVTVSGGDRRETTYRRESPLRSLKVWKDGTSTPAKLYPSRSGLYGSSSLQPERDIVARRRPGHKKRRRYKRRSREPSSSPSNQVDQPISHLQPQKIREQRVSVPEPTPPKPDITERDGPGPGVAISKPQTAVEEQILSQVRAARERFRKIDEESLKDANRLGYPVPPQIRSTVSARGQTPLPTVQESGLSAPLSPHFPVQPYSRNSGDTLQSIFGGRSPRIDVGNFTSSNRTPLGPSPEYATTHPDRPSISSPIQQRRTSHWSRLQTGWSRSQLGQLSSDHTTSAGDRIHDEYRRADHVDVNRHTARQDVDRFTREQGIATRQDGIYTPKSSATESSKEIIRTSSSLKSGDKRPRTFKEIARQRRQHRLSSEQIVSPPEDISVPPLRVVKNIQDGDRSPNRNDLPRLPGAFPLSTSEDTLHNSQVMNESQVSVNSPHIPKVRASGGNPPNTAVDKTAPQEVQARGSKSGSSSDVSDRPVPMRSPSLMREIAFPNLSIRGARRHAHKSSTGNGGHRVYLEASNGTCSPRMKLHPDDYWKRKPGIRQGVEGVDGSKDVSISSIHEMAPRRCASEHQTPDSSDISGAVTAAESRTSLTQLRDLDGGSEGHKGKRSGYSPTRVAARQRSSKVEFSDYTQNFPAVKYKPEQNVPVTGSRTRVDGTGGMKMETSRAGKQKREDTVDSMVKKRIKEFEEQRWVQERWQERRKEYGLYC